MRRMLDPKEAGGSLPSTIKFDTEGNRTAEKNLGVDGKLTLKSLVSETNPDGDITKELGGGGGSQAKLYKHTITVSSNTYGYVSITFYNYNDAAVNSRTKFETAMQSISEITATGYTKNGLSVYTVFSAFFDRGNKNVYANWYQIDTNGNVSMGRWLLDDRFNYKDDISAVS